MATLTTYNGTQYSIPAYNDTGWAQGPGNLSAYLIALATGACNITGNQTIGGNKTFTGTLSVSAEINSTINDADPIGNNTDNVLLTNTNAGASSAAVVQRTVNGTRRTREYALADAAGGKYVIQTRAADGTSWNTSFIIGKEGNVQFLGTATNDSAAAGYVGEAVRSNVAGGSAVSASGNNQWFDITSISLTAGDWDISGLLTFSTNGATITSNTVGISSTSGNSGTGLVNGDNQAESSAATAASSSTAFVPCYRVSLSGSATYYLKGYISYSVATPKAFGRISARRVR